MPVHYRVYVTILYTFHYFVYITISRVREEWNGAEGKSPLAPLFQRGEMDSSLRIGASGHTSADGLCLGRRPTEA